MAAVRNKSDMALLTALAIDRLGASDFYDSLLNIVSAAAPNDLAALVRYSRSAPPDLIIPRIAPTAPMMSYYQYFYAFDPFYAHWKGGGEIGVFRLREMDAKIGNSLYAREFLAAMAIYDEIAVLLPAIGDASPTLILDRAKGAFTEAEMARVRGLFPLLSALHRRHLSIFIASGVATETSPIGQQRPLRLVDHSGQSIFVTQSWIEIVEHSEAVVAEAVAIVTDRGPCVMRLPGQMVLRRTQLPPDFGPAPNGYCDEITTDIAPTGARHAFDLPQEFSARLTEREQQVALKMLQGYPVIEIARKLDLSRGTVKNYRLSIYRKLDITTERELFGEYIAIMRGRKSVLA